MRISDGTDLCLHCGRITDINQIKHCERLTPCRDKNPTLVKEVISEVVSKHGEKAVSERCLRLLE